MTIVRINLRTTDSFVTCADRASYNAEGVYFLTPGRSAKYRNQRVCMYVCLSSRISHIPHVQASRNYLCMLPVAVFLSSDDNTMYFRFCG